MSRSADDWSRSCASTDPFLVRTGARTWLAARSTTLIPRSTAKVDLALTFQRAAVTDLDRQYDFNKRGWTVERRSVARRGNPDGSVPSNLRTRASEALECAEAEHRRLDGKIADSLRLAERTTLALNRSLLDHKWREAPPGSGFIVCCRSQFVRRNSTPRSPALTDLLRQAHRFAERDAVQWARVTESGVQAWTIKPLSELTRELGAAALAPPAPHCPSPSEHVAKRLPDWIAWVAVLVAVVVGWNWYGSTHPPDRPNSVPSGLHTSGGATLTPTARCADGTYSYSAHRQGTCSWHRGVATWLSP